MRRSPFRCLAGSSGDWRAAVVSLLHLRTQYSSACTHLALAWIIVGAGKGTRTSTQAMVAGMKADVRPQTDSLRAAAASAEIKKVI